MHPASAASNCIVHLDASAAPSIIFVLYIDATLPVTPTRTLPSLTFRARGDEQARRKANCPSKCNQIDVGTHLEIKQAAYITSPSHVDQLWLILRNDSTASKETSLGIEDKDVDLYCGWDQYEHSKDMKIHYAGQQRSHRVKRRVITMEI